VTGRVRRVGRGGCWFFGASIARVAYRDNDDPSYRNDYLGFRLVEEPKEVHRGYRGGCWSRAPAFARVAFRNRFTPSLRYDFLGFRLVEETSNIPNGE
jgi:formylglycine-generating enzyme required for sulfatase activity